MKITQPGYFFVVMFSLLIQSCASVNKPTADNGDRQMVANEETYVIRNVNIIPMTPGGITITNATVIINGNKIAGINQAVPGKARVIDGTGKWLIPGLIDMHVHGLADIDFGTAYPTKGATFFFNNQHVSTPYVANGVTTIFDLNARVDNFGQRNEIIKGKVIGPRIALAALVDGGEGAGRIANTPSDGRQTVRLAKAEGYEFIKVYSRLNVETFKAITDEARKQDMKVVGHIPDAFKGRLEEAFGPNFSLIAHAEEFAKQSAELSEADVQRFTRLAKENGTWLMPTLTVMCRIADQVRSLDSIRNLATLKYVHPLLQNKWLTANQYHQRSSAQFIDHLEKMIDFNSRLVKAFQKAGIPIVAGTDAAVSGVVWGFALHDELALLVKAGLSPEEALASATRQASIWLNIGDKIGTIEVRKLADLILLDANPLEDINNTRKISGVFFNGRWIDKKQIGKMLGDLEKWNSENKDKYDWKKRKEF